MLTHLARTAGAFGRRDAAVALGGLVDKIHELKHKWVSGGRLRCECGVHARRETVPLGVLFCLPPGHATCTKGHTCLAPPNCRRVQVCEALTAISEAVGPQFVMAELHKRAAANKNPKASRGGSGRRQGRTLQG